MSPQKREEEVQPRRRASNRKYHVGDPNFESSSFPKLNIIQIKPRGNCKSHFVPGFNFYGYLELIELIYDKIKESYIPDNTFKSIFVNFRQIRVFRVELHFKGRIFEI